MPNFLTHLFFGETLEEKIGNLAYDFLKKPRDITIFPPDFQAGMRLHRKIDRFNDTHPVFRRSTRLMSSMRHFAYAHSAVDIINDHFLAVNWSLFCNQPLDEFALEVYGGLIDYHAVLPSRLQYVLPAMIEQDWLDSYATREGVKRALDRLSAVIDERWNRNSQLGLCMSDLDINYQTLNENFNIIFRDMIAAAKEWPDTTG